MFEAPSKLRSEGFVQSQGNATIQAAQRSRNDRRNVIEKQPNSRMCFVCGVENPIGLKLAFYTDQEGRCVARFRPKREHKGYPGQLHGGIVSTLLDEPTQISMHADPLSV